MIAFLNLVSFVDGIVQVDNAKVGGDLRRYFDVENSVKAFGEFDLLTNAIFAS